MAHEECAVDDRRRYGGFADFPGIVRFGLRLDKKGLHSEECSPFFNG
jgi:hypothetical protein